MPVYQYNGAVKSRQKYKQKSKPNPHTENTVHTSSDLVPSWSTKKKKKKKSRKKHAGEMQWVFRFLATEPRACSRPAKKERQRVPQTNKEKSTYSPELGSPMQMEAKVSATNIANMKKQDRYLLLAKKYAPFRAKSSLAQLNPHGSKIIPSFRPKETPQTDPAG